MNDKNDMVNNPPHYQSVSGMRCIDAIECALGSAGAVAFCRGEAIKHIWRADKTGNAIQDMKSAAWYANYAAEILENGPPGLMLGWIPWHGGRCPLPPDDLVSVQFADGSVETGAAKKFAWWDGGGKTPITAYKVGEV